MAGVVAPQYGARFAQGLLDALPQGDRLQVLDVGCGTGQISFRMLERLGSSSRVIAVDHDAGLIALARQRGFDDIGRRLFFKTESADDLSFGEGVFDAVVAHLLYRDLDDRSAALREMHRVLVPGGRLLLTTPLRGTFSEVFEMIRERGVAHGDDALLRALERLEGRDPTVRELEATVRAAGFGEVELEHTSFRLSYPNAEALFSDRLLETIAFPEWREAFGTEALDDVQRRLRIYFDQGALSLTVQAGRVVAHRSAQETAEAPEAL
jgi:ubiquinone/menaquinone biosynthesis C-methylase UbiE